VPISPVAQKAGTPQAALDAQGDAVFAWMKVLGDTNSQVGARVRSRDGAIGPVRQISSEAVLGAGPDLAANAAGDAVIGWSRFDGALFNQARARTLSGEGTLGPALALSPPDENAGLPSFGVDADRDAFLAWTASDGASTYWVEARTLAADGMLGPLRTISPTGEIALGPRVVLDAAGEGVVSWSAEKGSKALFSARSISADGVLGPVRTIVPPGPLASLTTGVDDAGNSVFAWGVPHGPGSHTVIKVRSLSVGGALGPARTLTTHGFGEPDLAVNAEGEAIIVWASRGRIRAETMSPRGRPSGIHVLARTKPGARRPHAPQAVIDAEGDAVVAWQRSLRVQARTLTARSALGRIATLSPHHHAAYSPELAGNAHGAAVTTWSRVIGSRSRIQAAFRR
jgi:hypothetical protein